MMRYSRKRISQNRGMTLSLSMESTLDRLVLLSYFALQNFKLIFDLGDFFFYPRITRQKLAKLNQLAAQSVNANSRCFFSW